MALGRAWQKEVMVPRNTYRSPLGSMSGLSVEKAIAQFLGVLLSSHACHSFRIPIFSQAVMRPFQCPCMRRKAIAPPPPAQCWVSQHAVDKQHLQLLPTSAALALPGAQSVVCACGWEGTGPHSSVHPLLLACSWGQWS